MTAVKTRLIDIIKTDDPIIKYGDPILRQVAEPIETVDEQIPELIERMAEIMHGAKGVGLAAPQLAISRRVIIYDVGDGVSALINPKVVKQSGEQTSPAEGCLSTKLV
jgi:peptide deformylase